MTGKERYIIFYNENRDKIPIFFSPTYLDIVTLKKWSLSMVIENDEVKALLFYITYTKFGMRIISSVPFLPAINGLFFLNQKKKKLNLHKAKRNLLLKLFENLPRFTKLKLKLGKQINDWRPLYWKKGFAQSTLYTSVINNQCKIDEVRSEYKSSTRGSINKAKRTLTLTNDYSLQDLYKLILNTFERKGKKAPFNFSLFEKLLLYLKEERVLRVYVSKSANIIAGCIVCVEDIDTTYYLFGGLNEDIESNPSQPFLIDIAIEYSLSVNKNFDFEGSMNKEIDNFFISFCPEVVPYYIIESYSNSLIKIYDELL